MPRKTFSSAEKIMPDAPAAVMEKPYAASVWEILPATILLIAAGLLIHQAGLFNYSFTQDTSSVKLGTIVSIGLVAAFSTCMALVGGMLLSISATWKESAPNAGALETFEPLLFFNIGRLLGYFFFGGLIGVIGTQLFVTPLVTSIITIVLALVMMVLGLRILNIVPKKYCTFPLPSAFKRSLKNLEQSRNPFAAGLLGALTFFIPCGFTQSMQLLALASGSYIGGGLIMLAFAFGTLPALLGISFISSIVHGRMYRVFLVFSGTAVILLGLQSLGNGLTLAGLDPITSVVGAFNSSSTASDDPYVTIDEKGRQIIAMHVTNNGYSPASFTVQKNKETWIYALSKEPLAGCISFMNVPAFGLSVPLKQKDTTWVGPFTPTQDFLITCSIGKFKANVRVL